MRNIRTGLRHSEIKPAGEKWVLSCCYHGSSLIISKDFDDLEKAKRAMNKLRGL